MSIKTVSYWLDKDNIIIKVNDSWDGNMDDKTWTERAASRSILGKPIFEFICDDITRMYVASLINSVRFFGKPIVRPYRCDSPVQKRYMQMTVCSEPDQSIKIQHELLREESLNKKIVFTNINLAAHTGEVRKKQQCLEVLYYIRCSVCNRLKAEASDYWQPVDDFLKADISGLLNIKVVYGVCPVCLKHLTT